ncbi:hypothetical protein D3C72_2330280 [compost metagenome]
MRMERQDQALHALQQGVVQRTGDARAFGQALLQAFLQPLLHVARQVADAQHIAAIQQQRGAQRQQHDEPRRLHEGGRDDDV